MTSNDILSEIRILISEKGVTMLEEDERVLGISKSLALYVTDKLCVHDLCPLGIQVWRSIGDSYELDPDTVNLIWYSSNSSSKGNCVSARRFLNSTDLKSGDLFSIDI